MAHKRTHSKTSLSPGGAQLTKRRSFVAEAAPTGAYYKVDWVWHHASNVNVANARDWFTDFTPAQSQVQGADGTIYAVEGIGDVPLRLRNDKYNATQLSSIVLRDVLYVPNMVCNIVGSPVLRDYKVSTGWPYVVMSLEGERLGLLNEDPKLHFWLHGREIGQSSLKDHGGYVPIGAIWPESEWARWKEYQGQNGVQSQDGIQVPNGTQATNGSHLRNGHVQQQGMEVD